MSKLQSLNGLVLALKRTAFKADFSDKWGHGDFDIIGPFTTIGAYVNYRRGISESVHAHFSSHCAKDPTSEECVMKLVVKCFIEELSEELKTPPKDNIEKATHKLIKAEINKMKKLKTLSDIRRYKPIKGTPKGHFYCSYLTTGKVGGGAY